MGQCHLFDKCIVTLDGQLMSCTTERTPFMWEKRLGSGQMLSRTQVLPATCKAS